MPLVCPRRNENLVDLALKHWNATTRLFDDRDGNRINNLDYYHGDTAKELKYSIHNEYFSLAHPGDAEWHHMGEGNMSSTISAWPIPRSRRRQAGQALRGDVYRRDPRPRTGIPCTKSSGLP